MLLKLSSSVPCLLAIAVLHAPAYAQSVSASDSHLTLTEPAAIAVADSLNKNIDAVSSRVAECIAAKAAPASLCFCRYPAEVNRLRSQYHAALAKFPAWRAKLVNWSPPGQNGGRTISMVGLERQLKQKCPK
jgi:hypothetical protein